MMNNIHEEPLRIQFSLLKRWDNDSIHKSICPICGGLLLMERNNETFLLLNTDRCVTCGQKFIYIDCPVNLSLETEEVFFTEFDNLSSLLSPLGLSSSLEKDYTHKILGDNVFAMDERTCSYSADVKNVVADRIDWSHRQGDNKFSGKVVDYSRQRKEYLIICYLHIGKNKD